MRQLGTSGVSELFVPDVGSGTGLLARVFLGRWHEAWATARNDKESALALLRDLLECADALETQTLREASAALLALLELPVARMHHQHQREQAVLAAVEETLVALRPAS